MTGPAERPLWTPDARRVAAASLTRFVQSQGLGAPQDTGDYPALWRWSVTEKDAFWDALVRFAGVACDRTQGPLLEPGADMSRATWCRGWQLNFAENLLPADGPGPAIIAWDELGRRREVSWSRLRAEVGRVAAGLRTDGVGPGDRVAGLLPNVPEAVVAMLATASIGASWSSCSPDFGLQAVLDRFGQLGPRVLFTADGHPYAGRRHDDRATGRALAAALATRANGAGLRRHVRVACLGDAVEREAGITRFEDYGHAAAPTFERFPFNAPLYVLYSSGTTGPPKGIVHGAGGTLVQHRKEHLLHADLRAGDRVFWFTTCGWMMWNWLVSALAQAATIVLYEGSPLHPSPAVLWDLAAGERVTHFGTSPRYLASVARDGFRPAASRDLDALRSVLSTGAPLPPELFDWVYAQVAGDVHLASISGGTDIVSCFALGNPWQPVWRGELQGPGLGMDVAVFDDAGRAVRGPSGELVCRSPFPSQPLGFLGDADGARYRRAYFERFPGVWHHGDYARITAHDGLVISGRSDAVLNPGGVRIGTAEIYRAVERVEGVAESLAVGQEWDGDVRVVLFVRLRARLDLTPDLEERLRQAIREDASPRHVPARIVAVPDLPRTLNGKLAELAVREVIHGREVRNRAALANPECLEAFRDRPELADAGR